MVLGEPSIFSGGTWWKKFENHSFSSVDFTALPKGTLPGQVLLLPMSHCHGLHIHCTVMVIRFCSLARHYKIVGIRRVGIQKASTDKPNIFNLSLKNHWLFEKNMILAPLKPSHDSSESRAGLSMCGDATPHPNTLVVAFFSFSFYYNLFF